MYFWAIFGIVPKIDHNRIMAGCATIIIYYSFRKIKNTPWILNEPGN